MKKIKGQKGSVTLFVLVAMLFFVLFLSGLYMMNSSKEQTGISETKRIKEIYEKDIELIDDQYETINMEVSKEIVKKLKVGDYIKYDTGVSTVGENGVIVCRVLYVANSEYGLQIISDKNVGSDITLGGDIWEEGKTAYNEAIETLNNEAEKYVNTEYAYDGRCVGSIPTVKNGMFVNKNKVRDSEGNILDTLDTVSIPEAYIMPTGWLSRNTGCYNADMNYVIDKTVLEETKILKTGEDYWLASRDIYSVSPDVYFLIRIVVASGNLANDAMCRVHAGGAAVGNVTKYGLRPCISLKSDIIRITGGDGLSENTAYVIGK